MSREMTVDEVLSTTRAVRRRLDLSRPVEREVLEDCLQLAHQAPMGSNRPQARFVVVTDPERRSAIGAVYRDAFAAYKASASYPTKEKSGDSERRATQQRVANSADYLAEVMDRVPVHIIPCIRGAPPHNVMGLAGFFGSVLPAVWSFMLAARSRGLGTCWTTVHLRFEDRVADILDLPDDVTQVALIPSAYTVGTDFKPAHRQPLDTFIGWNGW